MKRAERAQQLWSVLVLAANSRQILITRAAGHIERLLHLSKSTRGLIAKTPMNGKQNDKVLNTAERVLNPGAHGGDAPLYEHEVQKALDLIAKLEKCLA